MKVGTGFRTAARLFRTRNRLTSTVSQDRWPVPRPEAVARAVPRSGLPRLIIRFALTMAGLGLLSAAAWNLAVPLGLATAGVSCLVLEWAVHEPRP